MITQRIMAGLSFRQVADMYGTSIAIIAKMYWRLNDEIRLTGALADYRRRQDETIEVVQKVDMEKSERLSEAIQFLSRYWMKNSGLDKKFYFLNVAVERKLISSHQEGEQFQETAVSRDI